MKPAHPHLKYVGDVEADILYEGDTHEFLSSIRTFFITLTAKGVSPKFVYPTSNVDMTVAIHAQ